eukprot:TRINITY_DN45267_c0_g1_i1.p1 TRINITY_DN45267_c0_g1~~TRINITY_DN45267_c0_g1_i1.p1  ORF type:complete len:271 (-),score=24.34 TRINITY_DN45267_c0_g1_i1:185-949(-)
MQTTLSIQRAKWIYQKSQYICGPRLCSTVASAVSRRPKLCLSVQCQVTETGERLRLHNLSPAKGSRSKKKRIGRGYGAGQGGSAGKGMRGQKARSGGGTRPGFEGGQTPLWRRLPKLRGIAGGMRKGVPKYLTVNLDDLGMFAEGEEVTLESLKAKGVLHVSGKDRKLTLKVLGDGELPHALNFKAAKFSTQAQEKIEKAGGSVEVIPPRPKWTKQLGIERKEAQQNKKKPKKTAKQKREEARARKAEAEKPVE